MKKTYFAAVVVCLGVLAAGLVTERISAQVKKGKERPLLTKQLMKGLVGPHCGAIKKGLAAKPGDDEAWADLALHAALLNESSYILMADGRCPDGVWAEAASKTLREGSAAVLKGVEAKDAKATQEAFGAMTKSCGGCHKAHKGKKKAGKKSRI